MTDEDPDAAIARLLAATRPPTDDTALLVARTMARIRRPAAPWWRPDWATPWRMSLAGLAVAGVLLGLWLPLPTPHTPPAPDALLTLLAGAPPRPAAVSATAPPRRRWLRVALALSVGLNVLLGTALATRELRLLLAPRLTDMTLGEARQQPLLALHTVLAGLPPADATLLRHAFLTHAPALLAARLKLRTALQAVRSELQRDTIDPTALHASVQAAQQARADLGTLAAGLLETEAPQLSVEGRRRLAELGK